MPHDESPMRVYELSEVWEKALLQVRMLVTHKSMGDATVWIG